MIEPFSSKPTASKIGIEDGYGQVATLSALASQSAIQFQALAIQHSRHATWMVIDALRYVPIMAESLKTDPNEELLWSDVYLFEFEKPFQDLAKLDFSAMQLAIRRGEVEEASRLLAEVLSR